MDAEGTLETIAEIAISLTGFAGIVGALAGEKLRPAHPEVWLPFWVMISSSIGILFSALFPFLPHHLGASDQIAWATSSAFVAVVTSCVVGYFWPRMKRAQRDGVVPRILVFDIPLPVISTLIIVSQVLNTLGIGLPRSTGGFLIGAYLGLLIVSLNFVFLLYVLGRAHEPSSAAQQGAAADAAQLPPIKLGSPLASATDATAGSGGAAPRS